MSYQNKLWSELSKEEKAEWKQDFLESYAQECGGNPSEYIMCWEEFSNQEGYTAHDAEVEMRRNLTQA